MLLLLPAACLLFGIACFLAAFGLRHADLSWLAQFLGQAGTSNPKILEKIQLIPAVLLVTAVEAVGVGILFLRQRRRVENYLRCVGISLTPRQWCGSFWLGTVVLIGLLTLNFGWVSLWRRLATYGFHREVQVAADLGEQYAIVKSVRERTPENACIAIRSQEPIKYLLNYELFPRRFFLYSDPETRLSEVPAEWFQKHSIGWTLEIGDGSQADFVLKPVPAIK
ncbi:MAG TPA: hypothetical protein VHP35_11325 [Terriglobia bacterium]|nr:hypothetical protein [Terriglobia bacterium]